MRELASERDTSARLPERYIVLLRPACAAAHIAAGSNSAGVLAIEPSLGAPGRTTRADILRTTQLAQDSVERFPHRHSASTSRHAQTSVTTPFSRTHTHTSAQTQPGSVSQCRPSPARVRTFDMHVYAFEPHPPRRLTLPRIRASERQGSAVFSLVYGLVDGNSGPRGLDAVDASLEMTRRLPSSRFEVTGAQEMSRLSAIYCEQKQADKRAAAAAVAAAKAPL